MEANAIAAIFAMILVGLIGLSLLFCRHATAPLWCGA